MNEQTPADFLADVPATTEPSRPPRITKEQLTTVHQLKHKTSEQFKPITGLAGTCNYIRGQAEETAQTVYILIDDHTETGADVDPMLAQTYQALTRAGQLMFEAQTHLLRYVNKLENDARNAEAAHQLELLIEHGLNNR